MKKQIGLVGGCVLAVLFSSGAVLAGEEMEGRKALFNGENLDGWVIFPDEAKEQGTWSVQDGVIHCTGTPNGYIRTAKEHEDYQLHVEWRWAGEPGNSGVLVHMEEPDKIWPRSIEAQLRSGDAGDFYAIDGTDIDERTDKTKRRVAKMQESSEKPAGEWNVMEVNCLEDTIEVRVNGTLQNKGTGATVDEGYICLQSEGKPIEFRNVYLVKLDDDDDAEDHDGHEH